MNERVKAMWLAALRSGEFAQGRGVLRDKFDNYCCLGVLCELYRREAGGGDWVTPEDGEWADFDNCYFFSDDSETQCGVLTDAVAEWAGLNDCVGMFKEFTQDGDFVYSSLLKENDDEKNFQQIADIIEQKF